MYCVKCGMEVREGADFCENCGSYVGSRKGFSGAKKKSNTGKIVLLIVVIVAALTAGAAVGIFLTNRGNAAPEKMQAESRPQTKTKSQTESQPLTAEPTGAATTEPEQLVLARETWSGLDGRDDVAYLYDSNGNLVRKEGGTELTEYSYYDDGTLKQEITTRNGVVGEVAEYRPDGTISKLTTYSYNSSGERNWMSVTEYDDHGNPVQEFMYYGNSDSPTEMPPWEYEYDSQGRIESKIRSYLDEYGGYECTDAETYTYGSDGSYTHVIATYQDDILYWRETTTYDAEGKILYYLHDVESSCKVSVSNEYVYDDGGNLLAVYSDTDYRVDTTGLLGNSYFNSSEEYENSYDENGNLVQAEVYRYTYSNYEGEEYEEPRALARTTEYRYDDAGRRIRQETIYPDGSSYLEGYWEYDEQGNLIHWGDQEAEYVCTYLPLSEALYR